MPAPQVEYRTDPSQYRHIKLSFDGATAQLAIDIDENAGLRPGYKLKPGISHILLPVGYNCLIQCD